MSGSAPACPARSPGPPVTRSDHHGAWTPQPHLTSPHLTSHPEIPMPKRTIPRELTTSPPPAAPPGPKLDTTRSLVVWELKEAIESLSSARERRARAARSAYQG